MPGFSFDKRTRNYSTDNAFWLAHASSVAYADKETIRSTLTGWEMQLDGFFDARETQCFLASDDDMVMLCFRGTEPTKYKDWLTDLNVDLENGPGGRVHEGFLMGLSAVWPDVYAQLRAERGARALWVTGHSLGAALGTLAVAKLRLERDEPVNGLYTYGHPRTGDQEFARNFNADFKAQAFRHVHNNDIVPRVPFRSMKYSHIGVNRYYDENHRFREDISWWDKLLDRIEGRIDDLFELGTDGIKDHSMERYIECMEGQR